MHLNQTAGETHSYMKGFLQGLILTQRQKAT